MEMKNSLAEKNLSLIENHKKNPFFDRDEFQEILRKYNIESDTTEDEDKKPKRWCDKFAGKGAF